MTITSAAGVEFARELGCNLVVLARECSIKEIEKIQRESQVECPRAEQRQRPGLGRSTRDPRLCPWRFSSTARCASLTPANV